jgi:hypothetical protein
MRAKKRLGLAGGASMKATNSREPCQRVEVVPGNQRVLARIIGTAIDNLGVDEKRGEWSGFNLFVKLDGTPGGLAFQSGKTGWREFFCDNTGPPGVTIKMANLHGFSVRATCRRELGCYSATAMHWGSIKLKELRAEDCRRKIKRGRSS